MLEPLEVMQGFKDIRAEFHKVCSITKPLHELALWFSCPGELLLVHDWQDHQKSMVLGLKHSVTSEWSLRINSLNWGKKLVLGAIKEKPANPSLYLNERYSLDGYIPPFK